MGCVLAVPNDRRSVSGVLQRRGAQYTEAAALEETLRFCATLPIARASFRDSNIIVFEGKSFMFNSSPPESLKALQGTISPKILTAMVTKLNKAAAAGHAGLSRSFEPMDIPYRLNHVRRYSKREVKKINKELLSAGYECKFELVDQNADEYRPKKSPRAIVDADEYDKQLPYLSACDASAGEHRGSPSCNTSTTLLLMLSTGDIASTASSPVRSPSVITAKASRMHRQRREL